MKKTSPKQFAKITLEVLRAAKPELVNAYKNFNETEKKDLAILCVIGKGILSGKSPLEYYLISKNYNEPLWNALPSRVKEKIETIGSNQLYVIFSGWDELVCGYILSNGIDLGTGSN